MPRRISDDATQSYGITIVRGHDLQRSTFLLVSTLGHHPGERADNCANGPDCRIEHSGNDNFPFMHVIGKDINGLAVTVDEQLMRQPLRIRNSIWIKTNKIQVLRKRVHLEGHSFWIGTLRKNLRVETVVRAMCRRSFPIAQQSGARDFVSDGPAKT